MSTAVKDDQLASLAASKLTGTALAAAIVTASLTKVGPTLLVGSVSTIGSSALKVGSAGEAQITIASDTGTVSGDTDAVMRFTVDGDVGTLKGLFGYDQGLDRFVMGYNGNFAFRLDSSGNVEQPAKTTKYNNVATFGHGHPAIYGSARALAQVAAAASVAAYTVGAADGSFNVGANVLVTVATSHSFSVQVTYTDESNTSRTASFLMIPPSGAASTLIANAGGAVPWHGLPMQIRCKANTSITIKTTGTFTTVTYNVEGTITQVA